MSDVDANININIDSSEALSEIKRLQREISLFYTSINKGSATAAMAAKNMQQNLVNSINATGTFEARIVGIQTAAESFTTALEKNKLSMGQYFKYAGGATKTFGRFFKSEMNTIEKTAIDRVKTLQTQYIKLGRDANGAMKAISIRPTTLDMQDLGTKTMIAAQKQQILNQLLKQGTTNLVNFGKNTQWAGRQLMVGFTVPLTMLGSIASKTFMEMEQAALKFRRVYGDMFTSTEDTERAIRDIQILAKEYTKYGLAVVDTMNMAAEAAAMGKEGAELLAQVTEASRLAVLGNVEQSQALETTITLTNTFGTAAKELTNDINFLNAVENQTVVAIEDLTIAIPKAGPVIQQLGGDVRDLAFFLTAMKEGGINASEGANALKSGLASLINPTEKASEFLKGFGININAIVEGNKGNVKEIIIDMATALDELDPLNRARAIEQLFGKFQFARMSTLFKNVIKDGSQAGKVLDLTKNSAEELAILTEREMGKVEDAVGNKFTGSLERLRTELAPIGEQFLKIVTPIIEFFGDMFNRFNNLSDGVKKVITIILTVVGGIAPVALMAFGLIANLVGNFVKGLVSLRAGYQKLTGGSKILGESTNYLTQEQLEAQAVASSLDQTHAQLTQRFTAQAEAIERLIAVYNQATTAAKNFQAANPGAFLPPKISPPKGYANGVVTVPGPKGAGDIVPAMLSPGEAVIPAEKAEKYKGLITAIIAGKVPGFKKGVILPGGSGDSQATLNLVGMDPAAAADAFVQRLSVGGTAVSGPDSIRDFIYKQLTLAVTKGSDAGQAALVSALEEILVEAPKKISVDKLKKDAEVYNARTLYDPNIQAKMPEAPVFAHSGGSGQYAKISKASDIENYIDTSQMTEAKKKQVYAALEQEITSQMSRGAKEIGVKITGAWGQTIDNWINNSMANAGFSLEGTKVVGSAKAAKASDVSAQWDKRNIAMEGGNVVGSRWDEALREKLGKSQADMNQMAPAIEQYDKKLKQLLDDNANKYIMDSNEDIDNKIQEMAAKRGKAFSGSELETIRSQFVSMEELEAQARQHLQGLGKEIGTSVQAFLAAIEQAEAMVGEIRIQGVKDKSGAGVSRAGGYGAVDPKTGKASLGQMKPKMQQTGNDAGDGLQEGLKEKEDEVRDAGAQLARKVDEGARSQQGLDNASPSKKTRKTGQDAADGLVEGLRDGKDDVAVAGADLGNTASNAIDVNATPERSIQDLPNMTPMDYFIDDPNNPDPVNKSMRRQLDKLRQEEIAINKRVVNAANKDAIEMEKLTNQSRQIGVQRQYVLRNVADQNIKEMMLADLAQQQLAIEQRQTVLQQQITQTVTQENATEKKTLAERIKSWWGARKQAMADSITTRGGAAGMMRGAAGKLGAVAGGLSTVAMMGSMIPGKVGEQFQKLMMPLMALTMILPMLTSAGGIATLAITALVAAVVMVRMAFDSAQDSAQKAATSIGATAENMLNLSKFAGKVTASEIMDRRRKDEQGIYQVAAGKTTFGRNFVKSDTGKDMVKNLAGMIQGSDVATAQQQLFSQLATSVAAGAVTTEQARSIAIALGEEIKNFPVGMNVAARLTTVLGANGENLLKEPLEIRMRLVEEQRKSVQERVGSIADVSQRQRLSEQRFEDTSVAGGVLAGAAMGAAAGTMIGGPLGTLVGGAIGGIAGGIGGFIYGQKEKQERIGLQSGAITALQAEQLDQAKQILDSLELEYSKKIDIAKANGDIAEADRLQNEYIKERQKLLDTTKGIYEDMVQTYRDNPELQDALQTGADKLVTKKYKGTAYEDVAALTVKNLENVQDGELKYQLTMGLATDLDTFTVDSMLKMIDAGESEAVANIYTKFQGAMSQEIFSIMENFKDPKIQTDFIANISKMGSKQAQAEIDFYQQIQKQGGQFNVDVMYNYYESNPEAKEKLKEDLKQISDLAGRLTFEILAEVDPELQKIVDEDYFGSLNQEERQVYTRTIATYLNLTTADIQTSPEFEAWLNSGDNFPAGANDIIDQYQNSGPNGRGLNYPGLISRYIEAQGQIVTEAAGINTVPEGDVDKKPKPGGAGKKEDPYEGILNRLKIVRDAAINAKGGITELLRVAGKGKNIKIFQGMDQQLTRKGFSKGFVDEITSMDRETRKKFMSIKKGVVKLTKDGRALEKAFREAALGDVSVAAVRGVQDMKNQATAMKRLQKAGLDLSIGYDLLQDSEATAALSSERLRKKNGELRKEFVRLFEQLKRNAKLTALQNFTLEKGNAINNLQLQQKAIMKLVASGYSLSQALEIVQDEALAAKIALNDFSDKKIKEMVTTTEKLAELMAKMALIQQSAETDQRAAIPGLVDRASTALGRALTSTEVDAIINNPQLQVLLSQVDIDEQAVQDALDDASRNAQIEVDIKMLTPEGRLDLVNTGVSAAMQTFDAYEAIAQSGVDLSTIPTLLEGMDQGTVDTIAAMQEAYRAIEAQNEAIEQYNKLIEAEQEKMDAAQDQIDAIQETINDMNREIEINFDRPIAAYQEQIADLQREIELQFGRPIEDLQEKINDMQREAELKFERPLKALQEESTRLGNDLTLLDKAAEAINEKYDKQEEALNKIAEINNELIAQEKTRISLADAITQGDISAAAQAAQEMRAQSAQFAQGQQSGMLAEARRLEIESLRSASGMTREQIEERQFQIGQETYKLEQEKLVVDKEILAIQDEIYNLSEQQEEKQRQIRDIQDKIYNLEESKEDILIKIRDLEDQIYDINEDVIEPIQAQIDKYNDLVDRAEKARDASQEHYDNLNDSITVGGQTKDAWIAIEAEAKLAAVQSTKFKEDMENALKAMQEIIKLGPNATVPQAQPEEETGTGGNVNDVPSSYLPEDVVSARLGGVDFSTMTQDIYITYKDGTEKIGKWSLYGKNWVGEDFGFSPYMSKGGKVKYMPMGGMVPYMANGGMRPRGSDTVPAMLTPGEFVMRKKIVDKLGFDFFNEINQGRFRGPRFGVNPPYQPPRFEDISVKKEIEKNSAVYNSYSVNINTGSGDANDIARAVINQIKTIDNQRIRSQRV